MRSYPVTATLRRRRRGGKIRGRLNFAGPSPRRVLPGAGELGVGTASAYGSRAHRRHTAADQHGMEKTALAKLTAADLAMSD